MTSALFLVQKNTCDIQRWSQLTGTAMWTGITPPLLLDSAIAGRWEIRQKKCQEYFFQESDNYSH
jgi:hypothetical protein